jgi:hypothetical protein
VTAESTQAPDNGAEPAAITSAESTQAPDNGAEPAAITSAEVPADPRGETQAPEPVRADIDVDKGKDAQELAVLPPMEATAEPEVKPPFNSPAVIN